MRSKKKVINNKISSIQANQLKSFWSIFLENIYSLNNSKFFAGFIMLVMNIGSKYISIELSTTQESYLKYTLGRQLLVFAILWMGTRDIVIALILTLAFVLFADYLFNENSKFCVLPESIKTAHNAMDFNNDGKVDENEVKEAIKILQRAHFKKVLKNGKSSVKDKDFQTALVKENFL